MSKGRILVVEDDPELRRGLALRLRSSGYDVALAEDGLGAVSIAMRERPDVVLLDLGLPGGDGIKVLERYANLGPLSAIPVVVLTGRDPRVAEPAVAPFRVAAFLRKPAENAALLDAISSALPQRAPRSAAPGDPMSSADTYTPSRWFG